MYRVVMKPRAKKQLQKLQKKEQKRITQAIDGIGMDPYTGKQLQGYLKGLWSVRVWPYRIIYSIEKRVITVTVVAIGHRKDVYK